MNRSHAPYYVCLLAILAAGCSDDDDDDNNPGGGGPSAPSGDPLTVYVSNNGAGNQGTVDDFDQAYVLQQTVTPDNNEGVLLDHLGNLYQAGDATANGSVRIFSKIAGRTALDAFDTNLDRELGGGATSAMTSPKGIAVAHEAGLLMIADFGASEVVVYGTAAGGDVAPLARTALATPAWDVAYDEAADRLFAAVTDGTVAVFDAYVAGGFAPGAPGTPDRVITPADGVGTQVSVNLHGIALDAAGDRLVLSDVGDTGVNDDGALFVITGAAAADGNVVPDRTIRGPLTMLGNPVDVVLDGRELK
jgi:hypothetical protein